MPSFVTDGPDIPEPLLQAHEEGRVVFFCGAGISYPAGLPGFEGLVEGVYTELGTARSPIEEKAFQSKQFDSTIDQLERRLVGGRLAVRRAVASVLKPKLRRKGATTTHQALVQLATDQKGRVKLVTTNVDRVFEHVLQKRRPKIPTYTAPLLPIPKSSRWDGLVYLHGLLPKMVDDVALNRLVLTSGDFGLAYLTERWASRFVTDLFRNYLVCFVGYSINDPVLRYMVDALAADELLGESRPDAFAFAGFSDDDFEQQRLEWRAKGVTPLLYKIPNGSSDHSKLHSTLKEWAETYRDGVRGKQMIIAQHATTPPIAPSQNDFAVGRVLWALTDSLAAKHFADLKPVPPIEWLVPLAEDRWNHDHLSLFGVTSNPKKEDDLAFSTVRRPTPYTHAPRMCIVDHAGAHCEWDDVMWQLGRWLLRHLNQPQLVLWLASHGGDIHPKLRRMVENQLEHLGDLEAAGKTGEIDRIRTESPDAIPAPPMDLYWRLLLADRVGTRHHHLALYMWCRRFERRGLTATSQMELRELLTPVVTLRERITLGDGPEVVVNDGLEWELILSSDQVHSALSTLESNVQWQKALPNLLPTTTVLLREAMDLMQDLGGANDKHDRSFVDQPSISKHSQNRGFHDWTALVEIARDAWTVMVGQDPDQARRIAEDWWRVPYPVFKRLALFAATFDQVIPFERAVEWLVAENGYWLWSSGVQREVFRLLTSLGSRWHQRKAGPLERLILLGPPRAMFSDDLESDEFAQIVDQEIWLRLAKCRAGGAAMRKESEKRHDTLVALHPEWQLAENERDEFPFWIESGWEEDWDASSEVELAPDSLPELIDWLRKHPRVDPWRENDRWRNLCRVNFPLALEALKNLAQKGEWPAGRWRVALQIGSDEKTLRCSWPLATVLVTASDIFLAEVTDSVSFWLRAQAEAFDGGEKDFVALIDRTLEVERQNVEPGNMDVVTHALNHPVGRVTDALLAWFFRSKPEEASGLTSIIRRFLVKLTDPQAKRFRPGRVLLASRTITLFRIDQEWTTTHLVPLFEWQRSVVEAHAVWSGFLWSPRFYRPLISAVKQPFLETATHVTELGEFGQQYAGFLTYAALDPGDTFSVAELAGATAALPDEALQRVASTLTQALEAAGERSAEYWHNRVMPYLKSVWPQNRDRRTPSISEQLAELCVKTGTAFGEAVQMLHPWFQPAPYPGHLLHDLGQGDKCRMFPLEALILLDATLDENVTWLSQELRSCLEQISSAQPDLSSDRRYRRLQEICDRIGHD